MTKILIVDDEPVVRYSFKKLLKEENLEVLEAANGVDAIRIFRQRPPDLVVMDIEMPGMSGLEAIKRLKEIDPQVPVIVVTAFGTSERVIEAMKQGAFDYLEKPFDILKMREVIDDALGMKQMTEKAIHLSKPVSTDTSEVPIIGKSTAIQEVYKMIGRVAGSDAGVLITGESGTGKELVARAIHVHSNRPDKPFIAINCAAIPDTLLESELFGHEKGAFTDAAKAREGKLEAADTGTLFLDEIGDMSLPLQAKLLRVIQDGTFERLGSNKSIRVDVRIIAATNKNLEQGIQSKSFREDLFYRLKVITITLPPLRMRKEDIPILTHYFVERQSRTLPNSAITIPLETMEKLMAYSWPGNVRELENALTRAVLLSKNQVITPDLINIDDEIPRQESAVAEIPPAPAESGDPVSLVSVRLPAHPEAFEGTLYQEVIGSTEEALLRLTLAHTHGNQVKAARLLGISRVMLHNRMKKYGLIAE